VPWIFHTPSTPGSNKCTNKLCCFQKPYKKRLKFFLNISYISFITNFAETTRKIIYSDSPITILAWHLNALFQSICLLYLTIQPNRKVSVPIFKWLKHDIYVRFSDGLLSQTVLCKRKIILRLFSHKRVLASYTFENRIWKFPVFGCPVFKWSLYTAKLTFKPSPGVK
jgi:hypothetical protein